MPKMIESKLATLKQVDIAEKSIGDGLITEPKTKRDCVRGRHRSDVHHESNPHTVKYRSSTAKERRSRKRRQEGIGRGLEENRNKSCECALTM